MRNATTVSCTQTDPAATAADFGLPPELAAPTDVVQFSLSVNAVSKPGGAGSSRRMLKLWSEPTADVPNNLRVIFPHQNMGYSCTLRRPPPQTQQPTMTFAIRRPVFGPRDQGPAWPRTLPNGASS